MTVGVKWWIALAVSSVLHIVAFVLLSLFVTGRDAVDLPDLRVVSVKLSTGKEKESRSPAETPRGEIAPAENPAPPLAGVPALSRAAVEISVPEVQSAAPVPVLEARSAPKVELHELPLSDIRAASEPGAESAAVRSSPRPNGEIRPVYPKSARSRGAEGAVTLELVVGVDGRVKRASVAVSSGHTDLDRAALRAMRSAVFSPAREDGRPVEATLEFKIAFKLK